MNYYLLQIKEGPKGATFHDCVDKWLSVGYAAIFTKYNFSDLKKEDSLADVSKDVINFIKIFSDKKHDDSILISIGKGSDEIETLYVYQKDGNLDEISDSKVEVDKNFYKTVNYEEKAIGFKIKLLKRIHIAKCPLVLATIKSNTRLTMGTFKSIEDPNDPSSHHNSYFGNIKALEYILSDEKKKSKVDDFTEYLECLSPIEFETLIAKLYEEQGYFVPAYKGGMLKDYDLICRKDDSQENIQVKLNLSKDTYDKYKKKTDLIIYCVTKSGKIENPEIKIRDSKDIVEMIKTCPKAKEWLKKSLYWVDFIC